MTLGEQSFSVLEILTSYLRHLKAELAKQDVDISRARAVVAVPAHAYGAQRLLTLEAFQQAGFCVAAMLNEPSAAGFEYTHRKATTVSSKRTRVLVYDLGGGTFDTSLVDVVGTSHEVLASHGLGDLGGDDVDLLMATNVLTGRVSPRRISPPPSSTTCWTSAETPRSTSPPRAAGCSSSCGGRTSSFP